MFVMIKSILQLAVEQVRYFPMTVRLAMYDTRANNAHKYLGSFWEILDPLFQVLTYAVIFGGGFNREHHKKVCHTLCGCLSDLRLGTW